MKTCPHCNTSCEDNDIVCSNCGYLFSAEDFPRQEDQGLSGYQPSAPRPYRPETPPEEPSANDQGLHEEPKVTPNYGADQQNNGFSYQAPAPQQKTSGMAIAGMVLGIVGIVFACCRGFGIVAAIPGLIFSILSKKKIAQTGQKGSGQALAGIICSAIGIVLAALVIILDIWAQSKSGQSYLNNLISQAKSIQSASSAT